VVRHLDAIRKEAGSANGAVLDGIRQAARKFEDRARAVMGRLREVVDRGALDTETLNAMQVHSRHDLETMFSLGW